MDYTETINVKLCDDGFVEVHLDRTYVKGNTFRPTMYVQSQDVEQVVQAIEEFAANPYVGKSVKLSDGQLEIFKMDPRPEMHLWLKRPEDVPHGGNSAMDFKIEKAAAVVEALRGAAES